jgi:hypothetical protein
VEAKAPGGGTSLVMRTAKFGANIILCGEQFGKGVACCAKWKSDEALNPAVRLNASHW